MKIIIALFILIFSFSFVQDEAEFPLGIYATHKGTTAICLELLEEQQFKMILSTCTSDQIEEGTFEFIDNTVLLSSNNPPQMVLKNLRPADSSLGEGIILKSPDPLLLSKCQLSLDEGLSKFNFPYQSTPISFAQNIAVYFGQMEPLIIESQFAEDITTWQADIIFENINSTFSEFQSWILDENKRKLNQPNSEVSLKKSKKCWLY